MVDRRVDVCWKEQNEHYGRNPTSESPGLGHEETGGDGEFQDPRQIHEKRPLRDPGRQHLRHGFRLDEVSNTRKNEQDDKSDGSRAPNV
jgi:hypothetical protein